MFKSLPASFAVFSKLCWAALVPVCASAPVGLASPSAKPAAAVPAGLEALNQTQYPGTFVIGDPRADAPELAARGPYAVGVRTVQVVHTGQLDILHSLPDREARYDRPLTLEVWYPARVPPGVAPIAWYDDALGRGPNNPERPITPFRFAGRALRDAAPDPKGAPFPLVIVSHGYPGSRVLMTWLTENLASKGYIVVAIGHTESTHADAADFASTLLNRPLDDLFVLDQVGRALDPGPLHWLAGLVDADNAAIVGYSMGGYGALNAAGVGVSASAVNELVPGQKLAVRHTGDAEFIASHDPRIKAVVAFAPYNKAFDAVGAAGLTVPTLFVVGTADTVVGFSDVQTLYEQSVHADRYLLIFENASHNFAVNPPPFVATLRPAEYRHYLEPVWDMPRLHNINQHFVTAFLGAHLKHLDSIKYLQPVPPETPWPGFARAPATGLKLYHRPPQ